MYCPECGEGLNPTEGLDKLNVRYCVDCEKFFYVKEVKISYELSDEIVGAVNVSGKVEEIPMPNKDKKPA